MAEETFTAAQFHRQLAVDFYNQTWALMRQSSRTADEDARMMQLAHASCLHWSFVGDAQNQLIGEWQIARVYSVLGGSPGFGGMALYHARRCLAIAEANKTTGFFLGAAFESMARALAVNGDHDEAWKYIGHAKDVLAELSDPEEKEILEKDIASVPVK